MSGMLRRHGRGHWSRGWRAVVAVALLGHRFARAYRRRPDGRRAAPQQQASSAQCRLGPSQHVGSHFYLAS
ncbi:hypothetical protein AOX55_00005919 (plasmid) [Sinorhizobium fredii CCBAU 25509]|nr:hypothetical protein SF83666_b59380 [Sinorhizobium fredii CCBAU 83666]AWM28694.1 hypothetical protein AOX55_00005919 [Sinorhizobium fredii CCBAU 25509]